MAQTKTEADQDPSIEEILQSIRQIISEDDESPDNDAADDTAMQADELARNDEGIDLTSEKEDLREGIDLGGDEEKLPASTFAVSEDDTEADDILDLTQKLDDDVDTILADETGRPDIALDDIREDRPDQSETVENMIKEEQSAQAEPPSEKNDDVAALLSEQTQNAAMAALGKLAGSNMNVERRDHPAGITLEDIARDMMRPLLKAWLDENLPGLIERIVQKEIQKISKNLD